MQDQLTFSNVCHSLGERRYDKGKIPDDIKLFIELAACFFTVPATAATAPAVASAVTIATVIDAISKKGKIIDAAKRVFELLHKSNPSYEDKYQSMQEAYTILWVASFFDAFERTIPKSILEKIALSATEKENIANASYKGIRENDRLDPEVKLPGTIYSIDKVYTQLEYIYTEMSQRLEAFIADLSFLEEASEEEIRTLETRLKELPQKALNTFKGEYINLCAHFGEFAVFLELEKEKEKNIQIEPQLAKTIDLINNLDEKTDGEFQKITAIMLSLGEIQREKEVKEITDHIKNVYKKAITRPIIESDDKDHLIYPSIEKAFVPQHYKILEYTSGDIHLELEKQWEKYASQTNMLDFWIKYLIDPQNISRPILILGDPGGGKSLLTEMISASICSDAELVVRIPLRDYCDQIGEKGIEKIICQQIEKDGDSAKPIHKFKWITGSDASRPTTIIFDGYDEIQQATGLAYPKLLETISEFQDDCREENRPVRVVITSRRTLIDKAIIPIGTLVMKLLPFEPHQQDIWIKKWNKDNHDQLSKANLKDFKLPKGNKDIDALAKQPLLLLMLAMFDADFDSGKNALQVALIEQEKKFNRTRLYNEIIRRFIRRELLKGKKGKSPDFDEADSAYQLEQIDIEMEKLGIAALGMFVREKLSITISELKDDFRKLKAKTTRYEAEKALDTEEIFLGSFFFIHDSRKTEKETPKSAANIAQHDKDASFVFLHKTFYEFLTADYILGKIFDHVIVLAGMKGIHRQTYYYDNQLNLIEPRLFMTLCGSALCAEPDITAMISEWWSQKADAIMHKNAVDIHEDYLIATINDLINSYAESIAKGTMNIPEDQSLLSDCPVPQRNALYILNLVTIIILLKGTWTTELDKWRFLAQYIKLFSPIPKNEQLTDFDEDIQKDSLKNITLEPSEDLPLRFMALFDINCKGNYVEITRRDYIQELENQSSMEARTRVFHFLQDHVSTKIYSLHCSHVTSDRKVEHISELLNLDKTLLYEKEIRELQYALSSRTIYKIDARDYLAHFTETFYYKNYDIGSIILWLNSIREIDFVAGFPNMELYTITEMILINCSKIKSTEWNNILTIWLDLCNNKLNVHQIYAIIPAFLNSCDLLELKGFALYKCAQFMEQYMCSEAFYDGNFRKIVNQFAKYAQVLSSGNHLIENMSPQGIAGLLILLRISEKKKFADFSIEWRHVKALIYTTIAQYSFYPQQIWYEMPYLLRECIQSNNIHLAKEILSIVELDHDKIFSKEILEYLLIADITDSMDFLHKTYDAIQPMLSYNRYCMKLFLKISCILISHNDFSHSSDWKMFIGNNEMFETVFRIEPVTLTKFFILLKQKNILDTSVFSPCFYNTSIILRSINHIFHYSSQTAIEFLQTFKVAPPQSTDIQQLIIEAKLNEQPAIAEQLTKLLNLLYPPQSNK